MRALGNKAMGRGECAAALEQGLSSPVTQTSVRLSARRSAGDYYMPTSMGIGKPPGSQ